MGPPCQVYYFSTTQENIVIEIFYEKRRTIFFATQSWFAENCISFAQGCSPSAEYGGPSTQEFSLLLLVLVPLHYYVSLN